MIRLLLLLLLLLPSLAEATTRYVDVNLSSNCSGDYSIASRNCSGADGDAYTGANVGTGVAATVAGDTLSYRTGTYTVAIKSSTMTVNSGTSYSNAVTIGAYNGETVTLSISTDAININTTKQYIIFDGLTLACDQDLDTQNQCIYMAEGANHIRFNNVKASGGLIVFFMQRNSSFIEVIGGEYHHSAPQTLSGNRGYPFYVEGKDNLIERAKVYNGQGYGIHNYSGYGDPLNPDRNTYRYNEVYANCQAGVASDAGILLGTGTDNVAARNVVRDNLCHGINIGFGAVNSVAYNNTIVDNQETGVNWLTHTDSRVINNVLRSNSGGSFGDGGTDPTFAGNFCPSAATGCEDTGDPSFVDSASNDFRLGSSSSAIDSGTTSIGGVVGTITCNGASGCTAGAYDPPRFSSCSADTNTLTVAYTNNIFPPMANLDVTGKTAVIDSTSRTLSAPTISGSNSVLYTFSGAAVSATATFADDASGTLSDSADIADLNQKVKSFTAQTCSVAASGGTFEQKIFRFHGLRGTEATPSILPHSASSTNTAIKVVNGGAYRVRIAVLRNTADTVAIAPTLYYSKNSAAYAAVPASFGADNIRFYGTAADADIPNHLTATTNLLGAVGAGSFVAGGIVRTNASIPNASLAPTNWTEFEWIIEHDSDSSANDTFDFRVRTEAGTVLDTYTVTPRATIITPTAGSGA